MPFRIFWRVASHELCCSNYIFILNLTLVFNELGQENYKMRREAFQFWDLVRLIESDKTTSIYNVSTRVLSKK